MLFTLIKIQGNVEVEERREGDSRRSLRLAGTSKTYQVAPAPLTGKKRKRPSDEHSSDDSDPEPSDTDDADPLQQAQVENHIRLLRETAVFKLPLANTAEEQVLLHDYFPYDWLSRNQL